MPPGGLGVFETVLILLLAPAISSEKLLATLLIYRGIYYFLPLLVGVALLIGYELRHRTKPAPAVTQPAEPD